MELNIKNIDNTKLDLGLRHEYVPDTKFNMSLDEDKRIVVDCEYFGVGEKLKYSSVDAQEETMSMDFRKVFKHKVKGIRNLVINKKPVTTSEEFLRYPGVATLDAILSNVVAHIIHSDELTEDEVKNSSSGSSSSEENTSTKN